MILLLFFVSMTAQVTSMEPVSAATINVQNASYYYSGDLSLNDQIQTILNNAKSGDTIVFLGNLYKNLQLTINKNLNIVSYVGTEISGSYSPGSAVFLINGSAASGTQINGFSILNSSKGIVVSNSSYVTISHNNISSIRGPGIDVLNSQKTQINENNISNNENGVNIDNSVNTRVNNSQITKNQRNGVTASKSTNTTINGSNISNNGNEGVAVSQSSRTIVDGSNINDNSGIGVDVQNSDKFKISNSNVTHNFNNGVSIQDSTNATIQDNNITDNTLHGIYLGGTPITGPIAGSNPGNVNTVLIKGNDLSRNGGAGIRFECFGKYITIRGNVIVGNLYGISFGFNYLPSQTNIIEHNIITGSQSRDLDSHDNPDITSYIGSNFMGATYWVCGVVFTETQLVLVRTGENTYVAYFLDPDSGEIEADFPPTWVTFTTSTGFKALIQTIEGMATITIDLTSLKGNVTATSYGVSVTIPWDSVIITEENLPRKSVNSDTDWELLNPNTPDDPWNYNPTDPTGPIDPADPIDPMDPTSPTGPSSNPGSGSNSGSGDNPGSGSNSGSGDNPGSGSNSGSGDNPGSADSGSSSTSGTHSNGNPATQPSSVGHITATAAITSVASTDQNGPSNQGGSKRVQELFVDPAKDSLIYGIIGIIVLIALVLVAYYRKDLMNMIRKSK